MRNVMRFLMMFGPMIYRQYNKYMSNKNRQNRQEQSENYTESPQDEMHPHNKAKKPDINDKDFV